MRRANPLLKRGSYRGVARAPPPLALAVRHRERYRPFPVASGVRQLRPFLQLRHLLLAGCLGGILLIADTFNGSVGDSPYAGSESCRSCHERFFDLWSSSHHGTAMQPFTGELARTQLTPHDEPLAIDRYQFRADPASGTVHETGPDGEKRYAITQVLGGKNVFYFLTPLDRGRLQVLPLAYDVNRQEWFDTAASAMRHFTGTPDAPIFWKEPPYTFNISCFNCHVSQLTKNYDLATDTYRTTWREPGINCETCHGPSAEHVRAAQLLPPGAPMPDPKIIAARDLSVAQINALCGSCHARLTPLTPAFTPGDRFFDHFGLATLEDRDFHPDGRDLGENFTMTTWGLSPCAQSGQLSCTHCHTSSGRYRFRTGDPNAACLPCHAERVQTAPEHTRHPPDKPGNQCVACHMPMTEFARMRRSDHSMRPPAPSATLAFNSPNACTLCHRDQTVEWADRHVREWRTRDYQQPILLRAGWIDTARKGDWSRLPEIVRYLVSPEREEIWSASLLRLLRGCPDDRKWAGVRACLADTSPLVRAAAVEVLGDQLRPDFVPALLAATRDEFRLVRVQAAAALASLPRQGLAPADRGSLAAATAEYIASMQVRPDDSISHYNLGNFHLSRGEFGQAINAFDLAIRLQPQNLPPFANRAIAYAALGRNDQAENSLRQALVLDPTNAAVNLNLGLLLAELGQPGAAEQALRTAFKSDPQSAAAAYNLGVLLARDRPEDSLQWARRAVALRPRDGRYGYTLGFFLARQQRFEEATAVLENVIRRQPESSEAYVLLMQIYQRQNRPFDAARVRRAAADNPALPPSDRLQFGFGR
jgi:tetratricopeptide (TPR) repeat protein